jgi:hypothetical protein
VRHLTASPLSSLMSISSLQSEMLSVPPRPLVACRLVDRVPMTCFLTKMAAEASEKTTRSSLPGMNLCRLRGDSPPGPIERAVGRGL